MRAGPAHRRQPKVERDRIREHQPDPDRREIYNEAYGRYRDVYYALKPVFERV